MVASVGAPASAKTNETATQPMTAEMHGQRPDGAVRRERLGVQHAEVLGRFVVLAHRVGDAGAGVHAAQRGADEGQEHGERFGQHEVLAVTLARAAHRRR